MTLEQTDPPWFVDRPGLTTIYEQLDLSLLDQMTINDLLHHAGETNDMGLAAVLALMFAALKQGSLCLALDGPASTIRKMAPPGHDVFIDPIAQFSKRLDQGAYDCLIDRTGQGAFKPLVLDTGSGRPLLYFQKFHYHEQRLKRRLKQLLSTRWGKTVADRQTISGIIDELYDDPCVIRKGAGGSPINRDTHQIRAIEAALSTPLLVISGGPGTGKTSLLVNILRALVRTGTHPERILLAAPTGRAAQRMTESLHANLSSIKRLHPEEQGLGHLTGSTLHKLLSYRSRSAGFRYGEGYPLPAEVVAVDEVSMVDVVMMDNLVQAIDPGQTRLILIGDKDQLPSVEAGSVLADISASGQTAMAEHLVLLRNVYRSAGRLLELARSINAGEPVELHPVAFETALGQPSGSWSFVAAADGVQINSHLDAWVRQHFFSPPEDQGESYVDLVDGVTARLAENESPGDSIDRLLGFASKARVLTVVRHGLTGMHRVNERMAEMLSIHLDPYAPPQSRLFNGAMIMITRNDYGRGLFNGDVGIVLRHPGGGYHAWFKRMDGTVSFPASGLSDWELAFAMTVHKSQGSEFDDTLLILPDDPGHRLLTREIIYTAATRAAKRLIIFGPEESFLTALRRKILRQSGL